MMVWWPRAVVQAALDAWWAVANAAARPIPAETLEALGSLDLFLARHPDCNLLALPPALADLLGPGLLPLDLARHDLPALPYPPRRHD